MSQTITEKNMTNTVDVTIQLEIETDPFWSEENQTWL
jgi:hypothetical protein